ncbi:MAG: trigger factor [Bacilli bacterium]
MSKWNLNEDSTGVLTIEFDGKKWEEALDKAFDKNKDKIKVDGFREGQVPRKVFENKVGKESLYTDAIDFLLEKSYPEELKKHGIEPVSYPEVSIEKVDDTGVVLAATIAVAPELSLGEYKNLEVEVPVTKVTEDIINAEVDKLRDQNAEMVIKEGSVENGDTAVIDYKGFKDDVAFEGGEANNHSLVIGSGQFIPGFEEKLIGMNVGEKKDIDLTFPKEYHSEDLAGADVTFNVTVNEIKTRNIPELNDEFVKELDGEATNVDELKKLIKKDIEKNLEKQKENTIYDMLIDKVAENSTVSIPSQMIDSEVVRMINDTAQQMSTQGLSLEQYYQLTGTTEANLKEQLRPDAQKRVKHMLTLEKLIEAFEIAVCEEDVDAELNNMAEMYKMDIKEIEKSIGGKAQIENSIKIRKAFEKLREISNIKEIEEKE